MSWYYNNSIVLEAPKGCIGFVYLIKNLVSGKKYIGKKLFQFSKTKYKSIKLKNGKKKKKKIKSKIESDWQDYYGSSPSLLKDLENLGKQNFKREILYYCTTKAELSYIEAREQFKHQVLETDDYYNGIINLRVGESASLRQALLKHNKNN